MTVGHGCILHGCTIGNASLIGMGSKILDGAIIGEGCIVAAGSVITPGKVFPDGSMIMGVPGKVVRQLSDKEQGDIYKHSLNYVGYAKKYQENVPK